MERSEMFVMGGPAEVVVVSDPKSGINLSQARARLAFRNTERIMVRKTSSGFFTSIHEDLPLHVSRGYDRMVQHTSSSLISTSRPPSPQKRFSPEKYTQPYLDFMTNNPTIFHAVDAFTTQLEEAGYVYLSERTTWEIKPGGKYYTKRNGSAFIAFAVGKDYKAGNGMGIVAGHIDALTAKVKPVPKLPTKAGYVQLGVAPYAGGMNTTWWDRDLGIGGRVLVKGKDGKIKEELVKLDWPVARIPTLAPHFGAAASGPFNLETNMVPIVGIDNSDLLGKQESSLNLPAGTFVASQPERLVRAIAGKMGIEDYTSIVNWELELFDVQPAQVGGLDKEFIFAGRIDDKLCCFAAIEALLASSDDASPGIVKMVGCFDDEEIGSYLRQGARSNFMSSVIERIAENFSSSCGPNLVNQTLANSFLVSSDVIHAVNPNFLGAYLENHSPRLNVGVSVSADSNGHMTTDSVSTALLSRIAEKCGSTLQVFQIRNDSRSGGTIGPMTSSKLGCRAIDCGIPQLSMHSIRATTGSLDPGLGVKLYKGFFDYYEEVDQEFQ
ncbi:vacuolar aminopeptidase 1 [Exophiala xenobiotica]|uniref:Vacuolar aminopeptidase 1 n=1 Tax=Vermiconidia calcicola TaxID=1690605 RepID=A0AAV9Q2A7_9PEZI|nr:vacuolar aminopeptidase 1 [Exophiala xenobiotica]KAK5532889.1 vacuolar aminopeptidase 1 [Vermiconidia calcicola]KAK5546618.1 vacuolar aminopeptidase 1 [Chaetothyriales sp. CCFEE 6169]